MTSSGSLLPDKSKLAIVTPSCISSAQRAAFARDSLSELQALLGGRYPHIVVDDIPRCRGGLFGVIPARLARHVPNLAYARAARKIYADDRNIAFVRHGGSSSLTAVQKAVALARERGCSYAFIHLDDNAYAPTLDALLSASIRALDTVPDLSVVRLSAYPILTGQCDAERGNMTLCERVDETVRFDNVILRARRENGYTLWSAPWEATTADGRFWPIMLWNAVYRIAFLERLLSVSSVAALPSLGAVEAWYKTHWGEEWARLAGSFGFINMQFAGLERERNMNWRELLQLPNRAVL